ncbi:hypothetical protein EYC59_04275 [Candidatus Saccharibacteria bacterium]|nr:MAG: hypothetical protein EYC59_04275 [Candidatus Saccharibacteria bacterium]
MAIKPYLQTASTEVTNALTDVENQFKTLQHDADNEKNQLRSKISGLEHERALHQAELTQLQDDGQRHMVQGRASAIEKEINDINKRLAQIDANLAQAQQAKSSMEGNLRGAISQLSNLMGMPDLR